MNDKYSTTEGKTSEKLSDEAMLSAQWKSIDWHKAEREVNRLQIRIVKATQQKDYNAVKRLQYLLTHSFYAKALAVKRVVTNDGRRTPGVDGVLWNTPAKKMAAALSLTDKRYRARPLRRVYIEKKDKKKKRPLGIPTMYDRAMQALYALALEPVAETTADGKSFGFRKGRLLLCHNPFLQLLLVANNAYHQVLLEVVLVQTFFGFFSRLGNKKYNRFNTFFFLLFEPIRVAIPNEGICFDSIQGVQNRHCSQRRPEHGHLHSLPDPARS